MSKNHESSNDDTVPHAFYSCTMLPHCGIQWGGKNSFIDVGPLRSYVSGGSLTRRI